MEFRVITALKESGSNRDRSSRLKRKVAGLMRSLARLTRLLVLPQLRAEKSFIITQLTASFI